MISRGPMDDRLEVLRQEATKAFFEPILERYWHLLVMQAIRDVARMP